MVYKAVGPSLSFEFCSHSLKAVSYNFVASVKVDSKTNIKQASFDLSICIAVKDSPCVDCKRERFSKDRPRASVFTFWCVPAEQCVYYFDKTLGRVSSFEPDPRLVV